MGSKNLYTTHRSNPKKENEKYAELTVAKETRRNGVSTA